MYTHYINVYLYALGWLDYDQFWFLMSQMIDFFGDFHRWRNRNPSQEPPPPSSQLVEQPDASGWRKCDLSVDFRLLFQFLRVQLGRRLRQLISMILLEADSPSMYTGIRKLKTVLNAGKPPFLNLLEGYIQSLKPIAMTECPQIVCIKKSLVHWMDWRWYHSFFITFGKIAYDYESSREGTTKLTLIGEQGRHDWTWKCFGVSLSWLSFWSGRQENRNCPRGEQIKSRSGADSRLLNFS